MNFGNQLILALVQIATEFLPVSSSLHLLLARKLLGEKSSESLDFFLILLQGLTVLVVPFLFWKTFRLFLRPRWWLLLRRGRTSAWIFFWGACPFVVVGWFAKDQVSSLWSLQRAIWGLCAGSLFLLGDWRAKGRTKDTDWGGLFLVEPWKIFLVACAQPLAFFPGVSRLGVTWGLARGLGLSREASWKLSYCLGLPALLGASCYSLVRSSALPLTGQTLGILFLVPLLAYFLGRFCFWFLVWKGATLWVIYRVILAWFLSVDLLF